MYQIDWNRAYNSVQKIEKIRKHPPEWYVEVMREKFKNTPFSSYQAAIEWGVSSHAALNKCRHFRRFFAEIGASMFNII